MTITQHDITVFISNLIGGKYKHLSQLQLASKLAAMLPEGITKSTLQQQVIRELQLEIASLDNRTKGE